MNLFLSLVLLAILCSAAASEAQEGMISEFPAGTQIQRDVVYVRRDNEKDLKLDLYVPPGDGPRPLVIWIHGGAWKMGSKATFVHMLFLVEHGYAVASLDYRFSSEAKFPAQLDDCQTALQFLISNAAKFGIDPKHLVITGESAGGHLAALLAMQARSADSHICAVIDLFGPSDLSKLGDAKPSTREHAAELLGESPEKWPDLAKQASPVNFVRKDLPPFLILHGDKDPLISIDQSHALASAITSAGASAELVVVEGAGHAGPMFWTPEMQQRMLTFLRKHVTPNTKN